MDQPLKPEHIVSEAMKKPPEKFTIEQDTWDGLVRKYGEEKVGMYYKIKAPVTDNG